MLTFNYNATLTPDKEDGGFVVTFAKWPEAITQGDTVDECLQEAQDCLDEALASRIESGEPIPASAKSGKYLVSPSLQMAIKASLYVAMKESRVKNTDLAKQLSMDEKAVRRLLNPRHGTKLPAMEKALNALGRHLKLEVA